MVVAGVASVAAAGLSILSAFVTGFFWFELLELIATYLLATVVLATAMAPRWVPEYRRASGCSVSTALAGLGHFLAAHGLALAGCLLVGLLTPTLRYGHAEQDTFLGLLKNAIGPVLLLPLVTGQVVIAPVAGLIQALALRSAIPMDSRPSGDAWEQHRARLAAEEERRTHARGETG